MLRLRIHRQQRSVNCRPYEALLQEAAESVLLDHPRLRQNYSLDLFLIGQRAMREINREQRQVDRVTDVLSFPMLNFHEGHYVERPGLADCEDPFEETPHYVLGSLLLCPVQALEQAERYGHSVERELAFLVIHGCLHLLGYDHMSRNEELKMRRRQRRALQRLGLAMDKPGRIGEGEI